MTISRRSAVQSLSAVALGVAGLAFSTLAQAADTIKVGVLHSLSGTMAISETALRDTVLMMVEHQNSKGGLLGRRLEADVEARVGAGAHRSGAVAPDVDPLRVGRVGGEVERLHVLRGRRVAVGRVGAAGGEGEAEEEGQAHGYQSTPAVRGPA